MITITSKDNKIIKEFAKLKQKKYIDKTNMVLLEGQRLVEDARKRNAKFVAVFSLNNAFTDNSFDCPVYKLSSSVFKMLSSTENSQGIIATISFPKKNFALPTGDFLVLDKIADPGNLGTIIRTAVAFGFKDIYLYNCVDHRNSKVLRSTMGTIFDANIYDIDKENLKDLAKFNLLSAEMNGEDVSQIKRLDKHFGLVLGSEAFGVEKEIANYCYKKISLPMENDVESLNVAIAGGILMYLLKQK